MMRKESYEGITEEVYAKKDMLKKLWAPGVSSEPIISSISGHEMITCT